MALSRGCEERARGVAFVLRRAGDIKKLGGVTMPRSKKTVRPTTAKRIRLLIATRKGLWTLTSDLARNAWKIAGPMFHGHIVHNAFGDPRDSKTILAAARTGHLGPTIFRSTDAGKS